MSVIVPCYNEASTVQYLLNSVRAPPEAEIIVVDDGSTDGSRMVISELRREHPDLCLNVVHRDSNGGKGVAVRAGLELVTREYTVIQDADLEYSPKEISELALYCVN